MKEYIKPVLEIISLTCEERMAGSGTRRRHGRGHEMGHGWGHTIGHGRGHDYDD